MDTEVVELVEEVGGGSGQVYYVLASEESDV